MDLDDVCSLFADRPFKMTQVHRSVITRMIAVCRAAEELAEDPQDAGFIENLLECVEDLQDYVD